MLTAFRYNDRNTKEQMSVLDWNDTMIYSTCIKNSGRELLFYYFNHENFTKLTTFKYPLYVK